MTNTYLNFKDGALNTGYGLVRLLAEEEVPILYKSFSEIKTDMVIRTDHDKKYTIKEWLITCSK